MKTTSKDVIMQNIIFIWIALATGLLLLIPFFLMQFHVKLPDPGSVAGEINWDLTDFIVMGTLLFTISSLFVLAARKIHKSHRLAMGIAFLILFLWLWAELAVGIFTNLGS